MSVQRQSVRPFIGTPIDGRTLPGFDTEAFLAELKKALDGDEPGRFEYEVTMDSPPLETSQNTALFATMANALNRHEPDAGVVPYLMTGATDAKYLSLLGVPSYGFAPMKMPPGFKFMELFHAHDERAPVAGLGWGTQVLYEVVAEYCGQ